MAKFYGKIGFAMTSETAPHTGIYTNSIIERNYKGDILKNTYNWQTASQQVNDNLNINNRISIVSDSFAINNLHCMKYIIFEGVAWKINSAEIERPRIIIGLGGVYNGEQA